MVAFLGGAQVEGAESGSAIVVLCFVLVGWEVVDDTSLSSAEFEAVVQGLE